MKSKNILIKIVGLIFFFICINFINNNITNAYEFENELKGSTGWATIDLKITDSMNYNANEIMQLPRGESFLILDESGNYWQIKYNNKIGYIDHNYCMINLPDVMPSIVYNISNADSSIYKSSGVKLPDVTGEQLYTTGKVMNEKIGREEYPCPVLYSTAKKIAMAQRSALNDGYCLKIYDSYRPRSVSKLISQKLNILYNRNFTVRDNINYSTGLSGTVYYWEQSWFLAQGLSSHNTGAAIDVTLCENSTKQELVMPTEMHELSTKAIKYYSGSCLKVPANYSKEMTDAAKKLDYYMTSNGMTTLSSEWWHFQEQDGYNRIRMITYGYGCDFQVENILSETDTKIEDISLSQDNNNIYYIVKFNNDVSDINGFNVPSLIVKIGDYIVNTEYFENTNNSIIYKTSKNSQYEGCNVTIESFIGGALNANLALPKVFLGTIEYSSPKVKYINICGIDNNYVYVKVTFDKNIMVKSIPFVELKVDNNIRYMAYYETVNDGIIYKMRRDTNKKCYRITFERILGGYVVTQDSENARADLTCEQRYLGTVPGIDSTFDVNNDGYINASDASDILSAYAKASTSEYIQDSKYDVNGDGAVNSSDASYVLSYSSIRNTIR